MTLYLESSPPHEVDFGFCVVGVMGSLQALEAIKVLLGLGDVLSGKLLVYDALDAQFTAFKRSPNPDCPLCGENPTITTLEEVAVSCMTQEDD